MHDEFHVFHVRSSAGLYGAEYVILGLIPALASLGIGSTLLCLDNQHSAGQPLAAAARRLQIPFERVPCRGRFDPATIAALRRTMGRDAALLHVHDYKSAAHAWLARGRRDVPIVATSHGQFASTARLHLYHRLELALMRRFDRVCAVSEAMRPALLRAGVDPARIALIENGIDTGRFSASAVPLRRGEFAIADDALLFGSAMRLTEQKNPLGLIDAFAQVAGAIPRAALVLAGDGLLREPVRARAASHGIADRVHLIGARDDLERFYTMLDVFVLPSLYEGLPLALLEAMAAERRLVATDVGQVAGVLAGLDVKAVPPGDTPALAHAMIEASRMPEASLPALRERVVERFSLDRMAAAYAALYRDVRRCRERAAA